LYSAILVALDGSEAAAAAVPRAHEIARVFLVPLVLLRVVPRDIESSLQREYDAQRSQAEGYLESLRRSLRTRGVRVESIVEGGDPASIILGTAHSLGSPLVVITAYGRTQSYGTGALGHVAKEVLEKAEAPVLVVKPRMSERVER
jgi:nucleotide-binding universal stress UspA family protein